MFHGKLFNDNHSVGLRVCFFLSVHNKLPFLPLKKPKEKQNIFPLEMKYDCATIVTGLYKYDASDVCFVLLQSNKIC